MPATMKDLSRETGLGLATISSYFNGGNVREKNRKKIEEAIERLHYEVNETARGLKTNVTHTIGVVIPELNNIFCSEVISGMEDVLRSRGYATIICDCRTDKSLEKDAMEFLLRKRVDGIINMPVDTEGRNLAIFRRAGKPIVLIDRKIQGFACDCVLVDNRMAARSAVELLIRKGHRTIGIIGGPEDVFTARERLAGYAEGCRENGIRVRESLIYHGDYTIQSGVDGILTLCRKNPDMTAVFATNYEGTMGMAIGLNELGKKIPQDLSVVGFDNLDFARAMSPALTIVAQPTQEIGRQVAQRMLSRLGGEVPEESYDTWKLQTRIISGSSVSDAVQHGGNRL